MVKNIQEEEIWPETPKNILKKPADPPGPREQPENILRTPRTPSVQIESEQNKHQ